MIPKVIVQTSRNKPQEYIVKMIQNKSEGWKYCHYDDKEIMNFFDENPLEEFPNVKEKFYSFNYGEHRADLFRYYYLYVKGGIYFDTDAMIEDNIDNIVKDYEYLSVNSTYFPGTIFQGFIGCVPNHPILYQGLNDIYNIDNNILIKEFHLICKNMYNFVKDFKEQNEYNHNVKLYEEIYDTEEIAAVVDKENNNKLVLNHYHIKKIIPNIL